MHIDPIDLFAREAKWWLVGSIFAFVGGLLYFSFAKNLLFAAPFIMAFIFSIKMFTTKEQKRDALLATKWHSDQLSTAVSREKMTTYSLKNFNNMNGQPVVNSDAGILRKVLRWLFRF